ncbi:MAG: DUF4402 domain-containing protein [Thermoanaerobaculia bacterium]
MSAPLNIRLTFLRLLALGMATSMIAVSSPAQSISAQANATISRGLTVVKTADLDFGDILAPTASGTVTVSPAGTRAASGTIVLVGGTIGAAAFNVSDSGKGNRHFWVGLPASTTISNGASSMTVDTFQSNLLASYPLCGSGAPPGQCPTAPYTIQVGATLHVNANQPAGTYVGTFTITTNEY